MANPLDVKIRKLDVPPALDREASWAVTNVAEKLIQIRIRVTGFEIQHMSAVLENSVLNIKGNNPNAGANSESHGKFDVKFKLSPDVDVLTVFKNRNILFVNLIYDWPYIEQPRELDISKL